MKRSKLLRRTPLKLGTKGLKKSRLSRMSKEKKAWLKEYRDRTSVDGKMATQDRHHPLGRHDEYLLCYILIDYKLHEWIHAHGTEARRAGWLLAPYEGRPYDPNEPRAWRSAAESHWPEKFKRPA